MKKLFPLITPLVALFSFLFVSCGTFDGAPLDLSSTFSVSDVEGYEAAAGTLTLDYGNGIVRLALTGFAQTEEGKEIEARATMLDGEVRDIGTCTITEEGTHDHDHPFSEEIADISVIEVVLTTAAHHEQALRFQTDDDMDMDDHDEEAEAEDHDEEAHDEEGHDEEADEDVVILTITIQEADDSGHVEEESDEGESSDHIH